MITLYSLLDRINTLAQMAENEEIYAVKNSILSILKDLSVMLTDCIIEELNDIGQYIESK